MDPKNAMDVEHEAQVTPIEVATDGALALDVGTLDPNAEGPVTREQRRSRRKRDVRARTISVKRMTKRELELGRLLYPEVEVDPRRDDEDRGEVDLGGPEQRRAGPPGRPRAPSRAAPRTIPGRSPEVATRGGEGYPLAMSRGVGNSSEACS